MAGMLIPQLCPLKGLIFFSSLTLQRHVLQKFVHSAPLHYNVMHLNLFSSALVIQSASPTNKNTPIRLSAAIISFSCYLFCSICGDRLIYLLCRCMLACVCSCNCYIVSTIICILLT